MSDAEKKADELVCKVCTCSKTCYKKCCQLYLNFVNGYELGKNEMTKENELLKQELDVFKESFSRVQKTLESVEL